MATYVVEVKLPYERTSSLYAVLHSTSDTMFSPTFSEHDELIAHMFAAEYAQPHRLLRDYTEAGQSRLVTDLGLFLAQVFPEFADSRAPLPIEWHAELIAHYYFVGEAPELDASDVLLWYQDGDDRLNVVQRAFHAWRKARP